MNKKPKILLIEDDRDQIKMYQFKFELENFEFLAARSGNEGLTLAKTKKPDLILLDLLLINENGIDVLRNLKQELTTKDIPVIILTNLAKKDMKEEGLKLGAVDFIIKTQLDPEGLVKKIRERLSS